MVAHAVLGRRQAYDFERSWTRMTAKEKTAHNPKVGGSNPPPATNPKVHQNSRLGLIARVLNTACLVPFSSH
jgi:hypothetical protein